MKRKHIVWLHVAIWLLLVLSDIIQDYINNDTRSFAGHAKDMILLGRYALITIGYESIAALCFYGSYLVVARTFFNRKQYFLAILYAALLLVVMIGWRFTLEYGIFKPFLGFDNYFGRPMQVWDFSTNIFWFYFPKYFVYGILYFLAETYIRNRQRQAALQREKLTTELAFLRSQINPHFLFNTLNDIYALTYQKSDQAPEAVLKLSELLRYMLREGAGDFVLLHREIDYLHNLIELQRIGAKGNAFIDFTTHGPVGDQRVASLIFVSFVENAFKHGVLNDPAHPVRIQLDTRQNRISFWVSNKPHKSQKDVTPGIGLANVRRRLELLYPDRHELLIQDTNDTYSVHLTLSPTA
ncbi:sensor histidine kinase [Paraflavitalea pollutisoli]|uniref:sensor histidine kinase n=1 Tax=Paraflavitalea pollutisoli TaxID=3034143 RepID=UPI0023ED1153|nr:sensor histidine kinase [Paraflavitalea sp. H1-2-19X]